MKEKITRRQKDVSRLLRERKEIHSDKVKLDEQIKRRWHERG